MKWLRKVFLGLLGLLLACSASFWILSKIIKPETIRDYLNSQLTLLTSQRILIDGEVNWKLLPRPAIQISHITTGENKTDSPYSLRVDNLLLNLKIAPLLHGQFVFNEIKIDGLKARVNTNLFSIINQRIDAAKIFPVNSEAQGQFAIEEFMLNHGSITLVKNDYELLLDKVQFGTKNFNLLRHPFPLQLKAELTLSIPQEKLITAQISFNGKTSPHPNKNILTAPQSIAHTAIKGQLVVSHAKVGPITLDNINANTLFKEGIIRLNPVTMGLYQGEAIGDLSYDLINQIITINQTASNLDASALFNTLLGKKLIKGNMDVTLHTQTKLAVDIWPKNTQGNGSITIRNGAILSFNINRVIDEISNKINGLLTEKQDASTSNSDNPDAKFQIQQFDDPAIYKGNTPLKLLTINFNMANGDLKNTPIRIQTERLDLTGQNIVNLTTNTLTGQLDAKVVFNDDKADGIQQLLGGHFPLIIGGSISQPTIMPDLAQINSQLRKDWLKKTLKKPAEVITKPVSAIKQQIKKVLP